MSYEHAKELWKFTVVCVGGALAVCSASTASAYRDVVINSMTRPLPTWMDEEQRYACWPKSGNWVPGNPILEPFHERCDEIFRIYVIDAALTIASDDSPEETRWRGPLQRPSSRTQIAQGTVKRIRHVSWVILYLLIVKHNTQPGGSPAVFHLYLRVGNRAPALGEGSEDGCSPRPRLRARQDRRYCRIPSRTRSFNAIRPGGLKSFSTAKGLRPAFIFGKECRNKGKRKYEQESSYIRAGFERIRGSLQVWYQYWNVVWNNI